MFLRLMTTCNYNLNCYCIRTKISYISDQRCINSQKTPLLIHIPNVSRCSNNPSVNSLKKSFSHQSQAPITNESKKCTYIVRAYKIQLHIIIIIIIISYKFRPFLCHHQGQNSYKRCSCITANVILYFTFKYSYSTYFKITIQTLHVSTNVHPVY